MRTPRSSITYEALLAALTLGAMATLPACKGGAIKSEAPPPAAQTPESQPSAAATPVLQGTASEPPPAPGFAGTVDAGRELNVPSKGPSAPKPSVGAPSKPGGSAACGGSSCSPDMKKGN